MNPYVAEALAALQNKGFSREQAQQIIDQFLAGNPNDEHRLWAALDLGSPGSHSSVTSAQLLAAAQDNSDLANRAYVRNLIPANTTPDQFFGGGAPAPSAKPGLSLGGLIIPLALVAAAAFFYFRRG